MADEGFEQRELARGERDLYAQADDGSVWYLGEDVYDYDRGGLVDSTPGSWLAGREGPPEMIMPADPKVGDVHTAENIPAIDVAQSALDLELRHRPTAEIDLRRFELWANQILVDAAAGDLGGVRGDVTTMEWIRDRFADTLAAPDLTAIDAHLVTLRESVANESEDLKAATAEALELRDQLALGPVTPRD